MTNLHHAFELFQQGQLPEAQALLEDLIKTNPNDSQVCYLLGLIALQTDNESNGRKWFSKTVSLSPEATQAHYNLGVIYYNQGQVETAYSHYTTALQLAPEDLDIRFNLALACKKLGLPLEASEHFNTILKTTPNDTDTLYNLANTEQQLHNNNQAISLLEILLKQEPNHLSALNNLGYLYHKEGQSKKAIPIYESLIINDYNVTAAKHLLASLTGETTSHAPTAYVKDVFDQFADHFDESLQNKLGYNTPTLLRELLTSMHQNNQFDHALDLGCGTGLSGAAFTDCCAKITGIDLSPKMLEQAKNKGQYHKLHESNLVPFIQQAQVPYDLYIAADVFVYIGDLNPIFTAITEHNTTCTFLFSTEHTETNYQLKPTGRYGHSVNYITGLAKQHGFTIIAHESAPIRKEGEAWINGELYILKTGY